ncbi:hypothetical protein [Mesoflavibacter zeaxanthinifaciens]|uniref:hypothetical protein n=1 Tax=Mesoflavibacter zeaxanthinifaciens TaxID=393060 RepID=UPI003A9154DE
MEKEEERIKIHIHILAIFLLQFGVYLLPFACCIKGKIVQLHTTEAHIPESTRWGYKRVYQLMAKVQEVLATKRYGRSAENIYNKTRDISRKTAIEIEEDFMSNSTIYC